VPVFRYNWRPWHTNSRTSDRLLSYATQDMTTATPAEKPPREKISVENAIQRLSETCSHMAGRVTDLETQIEELRQNFTGQCQEILTGCANQIAKLQETM
jgi:uncharacterized protein involved in exopolysaccharide biosynthesis